MTRLAEMSGPHFHRFSFYTYFFLQVIVPAILQLPAPISSSNEHPN
jgi:hypothetical protein